MEYYEGKSPKSCLILALETSCDETSASVVADGRIVLSNVISSQIPVHQKFGGVVPEIASRKHIENVIPVVDQALREAQVSLGDITAIGVTHGPGLVGALLVGVAVAKALAFAADVPIIGVNHLEGHIFANFLSHAELEPPFMALVVSGGHTSLVHVKGYNNFELLGQTRDDAAGEAFDKIARVMKLPYPGGPYIDRLAAEGNPLAIPFPRALTGRDNFEFSFSGLKSAVLNYLNSAAQRGEEVNTADVAASFQAAVVDVLVSKTLHAAKVYRAKEVLVAGGVSANTALRDAFMAQKEFPVQIPSIFLCTDNAAMIAAAGYYHYAYGQRDPLNLDVLPTWALS